MCIYIYITSIPNKMMFGCVWKWRYLDICRKTYPKMAHVNMENNDQPWHFGVSNPEKVGCHTSLGPYPRNSMTFFDKRTAKSAPLVF